MICKSCAQEADGVMHDVLPTCAGCGRTVAYAKPGSLKLSNHRTSAQGVLTHTPEGQLYIAKAPWCRNKAEAPRGHDACKGCDCAHGGRVVRRKPTGVDSL